jgi:hypothetical protein
MQPKIFTALLAIAINLPQAYACKMRNRGPGTVQTNPRKCMSQGVSDWTFAMTVDMFAIPSLSRDPRAGLDGVHSSTWFAIYDHTCKLRASYEPCDGLPYVIMEDFLPFVLTVAKVDMDVGSRTFLSTMAMENIRSGLTTVFARILVARSQWAESSSMLDPWKTIVGSGSRLES